MENVWLKRNPSVLLFQQSSVCLCNQFVLSVVKTETGSKGTKMTTFATFYKFLLVYFLKTNAKWITMITHL